MVQIVSKLLAVQVGNTQMLTVHPEFEMSMDAVRLSMQNDRPIEVEVVGLENPYVRVCDLRLAEDNWTVEHIVGTIHEGDHKVDVTLHDNPVEASPLNLR